MDAREQNDRALGIVFVCYGDFNSNGGGHIAGFANALAQRNSDVAVVATGDPAGAWDFGRPKFSCHTHDEFVHGIPKPLRHLLKGKPSVIHAWTPRESVRKITAILRSETDATYCVHLEDNEEFILKSHLALFHPQWTELSDAELNALIPHNLSHPLRYKDFLQQAQGVTVITKSLSRFVPEAPELLVLEPGVDREIFSSDLTENQRREERAFIGIDEDTKLICYHGGLNASNRRDMHDLYTSILILQRRGYNVHLLRCGPDCVPDFDATTKFIKDRFVTEMGWVDKKKLIQFLKLADLFVQPGRNDGFNTYRLPSKIPEFLALGKPVVLPRSNIGLRLQDGVDAVLLGKGDGLDIADKVEGLLLDRDRAKRIGRAGRAFALREFYWADKAAKLEFFYHKLLQAQQSPSRTTSTTVMPDLSIGS